MNKSSSILLQMHPLIKQQQESYLAGAVMMVMETVFKNLNL